MKTINPTASNCAKAVTRTQDTKGHLQLTSTCSCQQDQTLPVNFYEHSFYQELQVCSQYLQAQALGEALVKLYPSSACQAAVQSQLGLKAYFYDNRPTRATRHFKTSLCYQANNPFALEMLGRICEEAPDFDATNYSEAEYYHERIAYLSPTDKLPLVRFYLRHKVIGRAREILNQCPSITQVTNLGQYNLTMLLRGVNDYFSDTVDQYDEASKNWVVAAVMKLAFKETRAHPQHFSHRETILKIVADELEKTRLDQKSRDEFMGFLSVVEFAHRP